MKPKSKGPGDRINNVGENSGKKQGSTILKFDYHEAGTMLARSDGWIAFRVPGSVRRGKVEVRSARQLPLSILRSKGRTSP